MGMFTLDSLPGKILDDRYQVDELIGMGAMGAVFRGRQLRLRRSVAIKVPRPDVCDREGFLGRFEREALSMAKLVHENIVQIHDVYISNDHAIPSFIAMEYVEGVELEKFLRAEEEHITVAAVCEIFHQIARGLDAAHERGIVHRDIKPSNIVVTMPQRIPKIMDFGVARISGEGVFATQEVSSIGTPAYMSPEQVRGEPVTGAADVYALAMTIYRLLTRSLPFDAQTPTSIMFAQVNEAPIPAHDRNPRMPEEVDAALRCALSKEPSERPINATDLVEKITAALEPYRERAFSELFDAPGTFPPAPALRGSTSSAPVNRVVKQLKKRTSWFVIVSTISIIVAAAAMVVVAVLLMRQNGRDTRESSNDGVATASVGGTVTTAPARASASPEPEIPAINPIMATPVPDAGIHVDERVPVPTPVPTLQPKPEPTPIPATPHPTMAPPSRSPEAPPATPEPARPSPIPSVAELVLSDSALWDPIKTPPLVAVQARQVRTEIERYVGRSILRPFQYNLQGEADNSLVALSGQHPAAGILVQAREQLGRHYNPVTISLIPRSDSLYWKDRAQVRFSLVIAGRPASRPEPDYRETLLESKEPLVGRFHKQGEEWSLLTLDGNLEELQELLHTRP